MGDTATTVLAIISGTAGIAAATGGVLLTVRRVRTKEQQASEAALATTEGYLREERDRRIEVEREAHEANLRLVQHGLDPVSDAPD